MSQPTLPDTMTVVVLDAYQGAESLRVEERPVPRPGRNQLLVKVAASPINPSDIMFMNGTYGFERPLPTVPGFEGSGDVVAFGQGSGLLARWLKGKRVACVTQDEGDGVWAEYALIASNRALPLAQSISTEQGAMSAVNPLSAVAMIDIARSRRQRSIINTAAASALGQMLNRLGKSEGVEIINIVRRAEQVAALKQQGIQHVLNSSDDDYLEQLRDLSHRMQTHLAFDAIGGDSTLQLLDAMPNGSTVLIYGNLSNQPARADTSSLIFRDKHIGGFYLTDWLLPKNLGQLLLLWRKAQGLLTSSLHTEIRARYPLSQVHEALATYQRQMTGGKILLVPGMNSQA